MAFKVVLVDDDLLVLQDLETLADWGKYGFTIAQTFTNGVAALRGIREIRPDFIVTDIRMPIMDGLQFVEKVRTLLPETRILLLTAYSDFDYAKKAIDLGVFNYLLKNELNKETLEEQLERVFLDLMRNKDIKAAMVQKAFRKFLYAPERRELQEELFHELAEHYGQAVGFFYVIPMSASEGEHFAGSVCTALSDCHVMPAENGNEIYTVCEAWERRYVIVLLCMKRMPASRLETAGIIRMAAEKLSLCLQKRVSARVLYHWFASKEPYEIKNGLSDIYKEAEKNGSVKQASIIAGAMENAVKEYVKRGICSPEDSKEIRQLTESFCDLRELFGGYERFLERIESEDKEKSYSTRVIKVIRFIRQNYEKDISVGDAAQLLGLNGEYLNKLFKKETGESFSRYLTQIRMEKAKELLESGQFNVSEVSARTGYKSSQYFSITFRRYMGYSPSEAEAHKGD